MAHDPEEAMVTASARRPDLERARVAFLVQDLARLT